MLTRPLLKRAGLVILFEYISYVVSRVDISPFLSIVGCCLVPQEVVCLKPLSNLFLSNFRNTGNNSLFGFAALHIIPVSFEPAFTYTRILPIFPFSKSKGWIAFIDSRLLRLTFANKKYRLHSFNIVCCYLPICLVHIFRQILLFNFSISPSANSL